MAERVLHRPRPCGLQAALAQAAKLATTRGGEIAAANVGLEPEELRAGQALVAPLSQRAVLPTPHLIHGLGHMAHDVEAIEHDLRLPVRDVVADRLAVRVP